MRLILVDTATAYLVAGVGEVGDGGPLDGSAYRARVLACADAPAPQSSNTQLIPRLTDLFASNGWEPSWAEGVVCGIGPGSFTGVRIGVSTAKGIAQGLSVPVWGVSTLDAIAWRFAREGFAGTLGIVCDAMRKEVFPMLFRIEDGVARRISEYRVCTPAQIAEEWTSVARDVHVGTGKPLLLAGNGLTKYADLLDEALGTDATMAEIAMWTPSASGLLDAFSSWYAGCRDTPREAADGVACDGDPALLAPIYIRLSDAEEAGNVSSKHKGGPAAVRPGTEAPKIELIIALMMHEDIGEVVALETSSFSAERWSESMFSDELGRPDRYWITARDSNGRLVGFAGIWVVDGRAHLLDIAVARKKRRKGIASQMLKVLSRQAQKMGAEDLTLEVAEHNSTAIRFYTALGFSTEGFRPNYYPKGVGAHIMSGPLLHDGSGHEGSPAGDGDR